MDVMKFVIEGGKLDPEMRAKAIEEIRADVLEKSGDQEIADLSAAQLAFVLKVLELTLSDSIADKKNLTALIRAQGSSISGAVMLMAGLEGAEALYQVLAKGFLLDFHKLLKQSQEAVKGLKEMDKLDRQEEELGKAKAEAESILAKFGSQRGGEA